MNEWFYLAPMLLFAGYLYYLFLSNILGFVKAVIINIYNLIILLIIGGLVAFIGQGNILPIELYYGSGIQIWLNIFAFKFIMFFLAMLLSLYPDYIKQFLFPNNLIKNIWRIKKKGLMVYVNPKDIYDRKDNLYWTEHVAEPRVLQLETRKNEVLEIEEKLQNDELAEREKIVPRENENRDNKIPLHSRFRKGSGLSLFIIWGWVLTYIFDVNAVPESDMSYKVYCLYAINLLVSGGLFYMYKYHERKREKLKPKIGIENKISDISTHPNPQIKGTLLMLLGMFLLFILINSVLAYFHGWCMITVFSDLVSVFLGGALFIYLRTYRKETYIGLISNDIRYLNLQRTMGMVVLVGLIITNSLVHVAENTSPLVLLMAGLLSLYTVVILITKVFLMARAWKEEQRDKYRDFEFKLGAVVVIIVAIIFTALIGGNDLHKLEEFNQIMSNTHIDKTRVDSSFGIYYSAYGGGLMANAWNMRVLNSVDTSGYWKNIRVLSGVSGGSMGIANYLLTRSGDEEYKIKVRSEVSNSNVLSIELSWLLLWDLVRNVVPNWVYFPFNGDRSHRAMKYYSCIHTLDGANDQELHKRSFLSVVDSLEKEYTDEHIPDLIFNSTSTRTQRGLVHTFPDDSAFANVTTLIDRGNRASLSFLDAVSTSNRFPIVSPAALISGKGHFLDGGYFENSALLSTIEAMNYFPEDESRTIIQVSNGVDSYLDQLLTRELEVKGSNEALLESASNELMSIINGGINLERLPRYLRASISKRKKEVNFVTIGLPYYIRENDVEAFFGGTLTGPDSVLVWKIINASNEKIISALSNSEKSTDEDRYRLSEWGVVNPPTSRVLSRPAVLYMDAILEHHEDFERGWVRDLLKSYTD